VTATQGTKQLVTTTDDRGRYSFPNLADGVWTIQVEMLGFESAKRDIGVAPDAPSPTWDLRFQSESEIVSALASKPEPSPAAAAPAVAATPSAPAAPPASAPVQPAAPAAVTPQTASAGTGGSVPSSPNTASGRRGGQAAAGRGSAGRGGRNQAGGPGGRGGQNQPADATTFQQLGVNQSADASLFSQEGTISSEQTAELAPSANEALVVQGSISSAMGLPGQGDFGAFGGRGGIGFGSDMAGMGPGMDGAAGAGGIPGMAGDSANPADSTADAGAGGGRGGAAGGGRGGAAGVGGRGGGGGFGGGGGGGGGGRGGGRGGRGGAAAGGRGGRGYMNMNNAMAFGNNRRNPRMMYTGSVNITERNSLLNAQTYSLSGNAIPKPYTNNTTVNSTFGGPLKIPKLLSGQRGQFTLSLGVTRGRQGNTGALTTMPTLLQRSGDFSQSFSAVGKPVNIFDPQNAGAPFPNNTIDPTRISPIAQGLMQYYPMPNLPQSATTRNYQLPYTNLNNTNTVNARVNQTLNAKNRVSGGFSYSGTDSTTPNSLGFIDPHNHRLITDTGLGRGMNANASYSHNFTTRLIGTLAYTFSRQRSQSLPYFAAQDLNVGANLGIQGLTNDPINWGPPTLGFTNFGGLSDGAASLTRNQTSSATATLLWVHKTHNFSWGAAYRRQQNNRYSNPNARGAFTFNGYGTSQFVKGVAAPNTGFDFADFLLATPYEAQIRYSADPALYFRGSIYALYFQDDWRLLPRLSLNFGLRWDYQTPVSELHNQLVNMAFPPAFTSYSLAPANPSDRTLVNPDKNNISPRLGIAWRPGAKRSTVLRAGFGIYYNTSVYSQMANSLSQQPPLATAYNLFLSDGPLAMDTAFANASSRGTNTISNTFAIDPTYKIGYAEQWQFAIQQNLPYSFQTTLTYHGAAGRDLDRRITPWVEPPGAVRALYPTGYTYETYGGNSMYNSANVQLTRRFRGGLSAGANYTFQKGIQDASTAQNWLNYRADRYMFTSPQALSINFTYGSGQGRRGGGLISGWKGVLVKDWNLTSAIQIHSGTYLTAMVGGNQATKGGSNRADYTGLPVEGLAPGALFNTAAFAAPAAGMWGDSGRNIIPGPLSFSLSAGANRTFRFGDRQRMTFSLTAANALNTVVVTGWGTTLGASTYGQPTAVSAMRSVNTSLRFNF
jgi:hypothetical protein